MENTIRKIHNRRNATLLHPRCYQRAERDNCIRSNKFDFFQKSHPKYGCAINHLKALRPDLLHPQ